MTQSERRTLKGFLCLTLFGGILTVCFAKALFSSRNDPKTSLGHGTSLVPIPKDAPLCGELDRRKPRLPPEWDSFVPPAVGKSYKDPAFGCEVTRLSSATENASSSGKHTSLMNYYSTFSAVNATDTMVLLAGDDGSWRVEDFKGSLIVAPDRMPSMNDGHPVWDAKDGTSFYYALRNTLNKGTIVGHSIKSAVLHTFSEYKAVASSDAADLSQDGDHIALVGQNINQTIDVFVWSLGQKTKTSVYRTQCAIKKWDVGETPQPACVHKIQLTPHNRLSIEFADDGTLPEQGLRLWDGKQLIHLQDHTNHYDTGYDISGNPIFIEIGGSDILTGQKNACPSRWGLEVRRLDDLSSAICLLDGQPPLHVSYRGSAAQPWAAVSFFDERKNGPEVFTHDPGYHAPSNSNWKLYEDEIVLARIDGAAVYRLAHARSRSAEGYWYTPRAAISRDGKYVVFTSSMAYPNGCPADMLVPNECTDVYLIKVQ